MDRRGAGMAPMMPFFTGPNLGDQAPGLPPPEMPPFPHMRERFPNAVWGPGDAPPQGQWGAFHPPGLAPPGAMGHPPHPPHQFNQFEPRQGPVFNFPPGTGPAPPAGAVPPVSQYNNGFNGQYPGAANGENVPGYVPQGHFSPQTGPTPNSQGFPNGSTNGFLTHSQGNGIVGGASPHQHPYPAAEYPQHPQQQQQQQQQQQNQQGMFKSPLSSPAVSAPEASPVGGYTMTSLSSPHHHGHPQQQQQHNHDPSQHQQLACRGPPSAGSNYPNQHIKQESQGLTMPPQASPHNSISSTTSVVNSSNNNGSNNSNVHSRLKNMIMSRQGGGSAFSPASGLTESPPLGELRFSGSVAAVTSVSSSDAQMHESLKMAQDFLACRTTESGPDSVVRPILSDEQGGPGAITSSRLGANDSHEDQEAPSDSSGVCDRKTSLETKDVPENENVVSSTAADTSSSDSNIGCGVTSSSQDAAANSLGPEPPDPGTVPSSTVEGPNPSSPHTQSENTPVTTTPVCSASAFAALHNTSVSCSKDLSMYDFPDSPEEKQGQQNQPLPGSDFRLGRVRGLGHRISRPMCARNTSSRFSSNVHTSKCVRTEVPTSSIALMGATGSGPPRKFSPDATLGPASTPRSTEKNCDKVSVSPSTLTQNHQNSGTQQSNNHNIDSHPHQNHPHLQQKNVQQFIPRQQSHPGSSPSFRMPLQFQQQNHFHKNLPGFPPHSKQDSSHLQHSLHHQQLLQQKQHEMQHRLQQVPHMPIQSCPDQSVSKCQDQHIQQQQTTATVTITTSVTSSMPQTTMVSHHPSPTAVAQSFQSGQNMPPGGNRNQGRRGIGNNGNFNPMENNCNFNNMGNRMNNNQESGAYLPGSLEYKYAPMVQTESMKSGISSLEALKTRLQEQYLEAKGISASECKEKNLLVPGQHSKMEQMKNKSIATEISNQQQQIFCAQPQQITPDPSKLNNAFNNQENVKTFPMTAEDVKPSVSSVNTMSTPCTQQLKQAPNIQHIDSSANIKTENQDQSLSEAHIKKEVSDEICEEMNSIPPLVLKEELEDDPEVKMKEQRKTFLRLNELVVPRCSCVVPSGEYL